MSEGGFDFSMSSSSDLSGGSRRLSDTNIFGRLMYKRTALTPGPCNATPLAFQPGRRNARWQQSDASSVNQDSDCETRSVTGGGSVSKDSLFILMFSGKQSWFQERQSVVDQGSWTGTQLVEKRCRSAGTECVFNNSDAALENDSRRSALLVRLQDIAHLQTCSLHSRVAQF